MTRNRSSIQSMFWSAGNRAWQSVMGKPKRKKRPKYVKGVNRGNYYRRKIVAPPPEAPSVPKLPKTGQNIMPQPLTSPPPLPSASASTPAGSSANAATASASTLVSRTAQQESSGGANQKYRERLFAWLKQNSAVLILNFGSLCTLVGFTRKDVLELRVLSATGSVTFCIYQFLQPPPIRWPPVLWSMLFASVNGYNIAKIMVERTGKVVLTEEEEDLFVEHFMPHGVTPKQFERIIKCARRVKVPKGRAIVRKGEPLDHVFLVVKGSTRASAGGRRLTAASSMPGHAEKLRGGDSGAWIGEMAFLELFGQEETDEKSQTRQPRRMEHSYYTIAAQDDSTEVLVWAHEDLKKLMHVSHDMRAAMTRAMTAAIVGKVINFSVSKRTSGMLPPTWSTWLDDWKNSGANIRTTLVEQKEEAEVGFEPV